MAATIFPFFLCLHQIAGGCLGGCLGVVLCLMKKRRRSADFLRDNTTDVRILLLVRVSL